MNTGLKKKNHQKNQTSGCFNCTFYAETSNNIELFIDCCFKTLLTMPSKGSTKIVIHPLKEFPL